MTEPRTFTMLGTSLFKILLATKFTSYISLGTSEILISRSLALANDGEQFIQAGLR